MFQTLEMLDRVKTKSTRYFLTQYLQISKTKHLAQLFSKSLSIDYNGLKEYDNLCPLSFQNIEDQLSRVKELKILRTFIFSQLKIHPKN